jgi:hypothetical protein
MVTRRLQQPRERWIFSVVHPAYQLATKQIQPALRRMRQDLIDRAPDVCIRQQSREIRPGLQYEGTYSTEIKAAGQISTARCAISSYIMVPRVEPSNDQCHRFQGW